MSLSTSELAKARETAKVILEALQLDAYLYEIEPHNDTWELLIECACEINGGWQRVSLQVPKDMLLEGLEDSRVKQHLFEYWKKKLNGCKERRA